MARRKRTRRLWPPAMEALLRQLYPDTATWKLARRFKRPRAQVYAKAAKLGLKKSAAYLAGPEACRLRRGDNIGAPYRFPKGHVPANKGLRRPGWAAGRMQETQFKKGQQNHNIMPVGATRLVDGYLYVKVAAVRYVPYTVNWLPLHVLNWERANGRLLPKGHCLWFRDGNRGNVDPANLELITRAENMRRNTVHNLPKPLAELVQLRGALQRQINRREGKREKQDRGSSQPPVRDARGAQGQGSPHGDRARQGDLRRRADDHQQRQGRGRLSQDARRQQR